MAALRQARSSSATRPSAWAAPKSARGRLERRALRAAGERLVGDRGPGVEVDDRLVERAHPAAAEQLRERAGEVRGAATEEGMRVLSADAPRRARGPSHPGPARNPATAGVSGGRTTPAESPHPQGAVNGGTEAVRGWPRGRIAVHSDGVALSRREPDSSPRRCTVGEKTEISGHGYPAQPGPHSRIAAILALAFCAAPERPCRRRSRRAPRARASRSCRRSSASTSTASTASRPSAPSSASSAATA